MKRFQLSIWCIFVGHYLYIEVNNRDDGDVARLTSPQMSIDDSYDPICMTFWYHMSGSDIGELQIIREESGDDNQLWSMSGWF